MQYQVATILEADELDMLKIDEKGLMWADKVVTQQAAIMF